jgi:hypothetical protein
MEPIKIPRRNLAYISKLTRRSSLLTIEKLSALETRLGTTKTQRKTTIDTSKTCARLRQPKTNQKAAQVLTSISLNTL